MAFLPDRKEMRAVQLDFIGSCDLHDGIYFNFYSDMQPTKRLILQTAITLFSESGYANASMRDIAGAVGIKPSSIYNHFDNKQHILHTVFERLKRSLVFMYNDGELDALIASERPTREVLDVTVGSRRLFEGEQADVFRKCVRIAAMQQYTDACAYDALVALFLIELPQYFARALDKLIRARRIAPCRTRMVSDLLARTAFTYIIEYSHNRPHADADGNNTPTLRQLNDLICDTFFAIVEEG